MQFFWHLAFFALGLAVGWAAFKFCSKKKSIENEEEECIEKEECMSVADETDFGKEERWKCFIDDDYARRSQKCCNFCQHLLREPISTLGYGEVNSHKWHCEKLGYVVDETTSPIGVVNRPADCPRKEV